MLKELKITNFAVIENLTVNFGPGFNVLTGETGAGKSIIIDALALALGGRADTESIRTGHNSAAVEALFYVKNPKTLDQILELGSEIEDGQLIVKRILSLNDKNRALLNGSNITVGSLGKIGDCLVDIHGQHDHQTLLHPENHLEVLDLFGKLIPDKNHFYQALSDYRTLEREIKSLSSNESEKLQRKDLLNFQIKEIDQANLSPQEEETLKLEKNKLLNMEKIQQALQLSLDLLIDGENTICEKLSITSQELKQPSEFDPHLEKIAQDAQSIFYEIEDLADKLRAYAQCIEFQPGRLEEIDDRLDEINTLKRKYGSEITSVLEYRDQIDSELQNLSLSQGKMETLTAEFLQRQKKLEKITVLLAKKREKVATALKKDMEKELGELNMPKTRFGARFSYEKDPEGFITFQGKKVRLLPTGIGTFEFLFSPNPGEDMRSLSKIASGGELSRVMLALKTILNAQDLVPVLIFDEVDSGIGGKVAEEVGIRLKKIAARKQVFCITHLPQIAGMASTHFSIDKVVTGKRTRTSIRELDFEERIEEIARMSGGKIITETTRKHAKEMINPG